MTFGYLDSSCLVAVALEQPGHVRLTRNVRSLEVRFSSGLLEAELRSALLREEASTDVAAVLSEIEWICPERPLSGEITTVLNAGRLKGADLWHVACALFLGQRFGEPISFLTLDERQREVSAELGFLTPV